MTTQISAPVRIVALVGLLAALAMGAWMMLGARAGGSSADTAEASLIPTKAIGQAQAAASKLNAHNVATAHGTTAAAAAKKKVAAAKPVAPAKPKPVAAAKPKHTAPLPDGTPHTIAALLQAHASVVVLLYDPEAKVDSYSLGEAVLGANEAGAGFLRVNVLDQSEAAPFTKAYGILQDPTLLFFTRPGKLVQKLSGFADHETVAQAAANAALGLGTHGASAAAAAAAAAAPVTPPAAPATAPVVTP